MKDLNFKLEPRYHAAFRVLAEEWARKNDQPLSTCGAAYIRAQISKAAKRSPAARRVLKENQ